MIFRSDESGTTDNFQKYLDAASDGAWGKGAGKSFAGGVGEGAKGNEGTSAAIASTPGSITYNEWSFAKAQNLSIAKIITSAGPEPVELNTESAGVAIDGVKFKGEGNDLVLDTASFYMPTEPGGSYPIMLAAYEIVCSQYPRSRGGHRGEGVHALGARQRADRSRGERLHPGARGVQDSAHRGRRRHQLDVLVVTTRWPLHRTRPLWARQQDRRAHSRSGGILPKCPRNPAKGRH